MNSHSDQTRLRHVLDHRFGFLMTFLKSYSFSAVGFNFLLSCITVLWSPIAHSVAFAMVDKFLDHKVSLEPSLSATVN